MRSQWKKALNWFILRKYSFAAYIANGMNSVTIYRLIDLMYIVRQTKIHSEFSYFSHEQRPATLERQIFQVVASLSLSRKEETPRSSIEMLLWYLLSQLFTSRCCMLLISSWENAAFQAYENSRIRSANFANYDFLKKQIVQIDGFYRWTFVYHVSAPLRRSRDMNYSLARCINDP